MPWKKVIVMTDLVQAYRKGRSDGEHSVLRMIADILDNHDEWSDLTTYYKSSLEMILEVYEYGE